MVQLTIKRPEESFNKSYSYPIYVNGEHITDVSNNSEQTVRVDADKISIKAKMGWSGSKRITLDGKNRNSLKVEVRGNKFYNRVVRYTGGVIFPGLAAVWAITPDSAALNYGLFVTGILILSLLVYTLTADRNSWIFLSEIEPNPEKVYT